MSFGGDSFTFDNISSDRFNLKITTPETKSTINISNYKSNLIKTNRQSKFYATRQTVDEPLILEVSIFSENGVPLTRSQLDQIENWLFRPDGKFRKLRINQEDMKGYYYNCRLQKLEAETYANNIFVLNCLMECDSIFIWQNPQTRVYTINSTPYVAKFVNISSENLMSPTYQITVGVVNGLMKIESTGRTIKIVNSNITDESQNTMEFIGLLDNEVLTIDTEHEIITSNMRTSGLLDLFTNINFMKLPKGNNTFTITGDIVELKINYQNGRKVGN